MGFSRQDILTEFAEAAALSRFGYVRDFEGMILEAATRYALKGRLRAAEWLAHNRDRKRQYMVVYNQRDGVLSRERQRHRDRRARFKEMGLDSNGKKKSNGT